MKFAAALNGIDPSRRPRVRGPGQGLYAADDPPLSSTPAAVATTVVFRLASDRTRRGDTAAFRTSATALEPALGGGSRSRRSRSRSSFEACSGLARRFKTVTPDLFQDCSRTIVRSGSPKTIPAYGGRRRITGYTRSFLLMNSNYAES